MAALLNLQNGLVDELRCAPVVFACVSGQTDQGIELSDGMCDCLQRLMWGNSSCNNFSYNIFAYQGTFLADSALSSNALSSGVM
jgi:hypothetical protein